MTRLGVNRIIAMIVTVLAIIGPQSILYENWLYYTYAVAALMALAALLLHRYLVTGRMRDGLLFFMMLSLVILTRSLFHLGWMMAVVALLIYFRRGQWKQIILAALLPLLLVVSLYVKNAVVAGSFASSTWMGMNLSRKTTFLMPEEMRREEVRRGELSPLALIGPFNGLTAYDHIPYRRTHTGIPALDQIWKAHDCPNLNNLAYAEISRGYLADAKHIITAHPGIYLRGCALGFFTYALPSSNYYFVERNRRMIPTYERVYNLLIFGQLLPFEAAPLDDQAEGYIGKKLLIRGWFLVIGLPILFWYGFRRARRAAPSGVGASAF
jgi:hypothetical protein